jgi:hypothetical protein
MSSQTTPSNTCPSIEEVVSTSSGAEFRNDVQLSQFRSEHNLELAKDFIFTAKAAPGRKSSLELLRFLCEAFMPGASPNRFVFIATYGHGKSHFAVALANYFGKAAVTPECQRILGRIKHAAPEPPVYGFFEAFKRNNKPCLILILRGDEPSDLQTKFFRAVEEALQFDNDSEIHAPFWYSDAERFVRSIMADTIARRESANSFLSRYRMDLDILVERISSQDATTFEITRGLCEHLNHFTPEFGTGLSLKEGVEWLGKNLVGQEKPYGGVLILFDEFSSFVRDYALGMKHRPGAPLQDLLNGVESMRGKVAFAALAQRDPELIATSLLSGESLQSLTTQLNRLPKPNHHQLHSSLEEVLNAYVKQDTDAWTILLRNSAFSAALGQANDLAFEVFSTRYQSVLKWDIEHFQGVVTQGCFPLHPSTTALLSSVELQTSSNPRSVLGFVQKQMDYLRGRPCFQGDGPAWVLPTALVDYFREMLGEKPWRDYSDALAQAGGPDATQEQQAVLKAMLLQTSGQLATKGVYTRVIAHISGLAVERASKELQGLAASGIIHREISSGVYTFWPSGRGANKVNQLLSEKLKGKTLDAAVVDFLNNWLRSQNVLRDICVPVPWGHRDDWRAEQILVTRTTFTPEAIKEALVTRINQQPQGSDKARGLLIWSLAETPDDAAWFRENMDDVIAAALPAQYIPLVLSRPDIPDPGLAQQLLRLYGLSLFSNTEIADVGSEQFQAVRELANQSVVTEFPRLKDEAQMDVPAAFRARVKTLRSADVEEVLGEVFKMAFSDGPKRWFDQYKLSSPKFRSSVMRVANHLLENNVDAPGIFTADPVAKDIAQRLKSEWSVLNYDLRIKVPPKGGNVWPTWQLLEDYFPADGPAKRLTDLISQLLNAPYGYDHNTLTLMLSAWCGYHRHDLEISRQGRLLTLSSIAKDLKPKDFVEALADLTVKRANADVIRSKVRELIEQVERGSFTQAEASDSLHLLEQAQKREDIEQKDAIESAASRLRKSIEESNKYDAEAAKVESYLASNRTLADLSKVLVHVSRMHMPERVRPVKASPAALRDLTLRKIAEDATQKCKRYSQLDTIADYALNEKQLQTIRHALSQMQLMDLTKLADESLSELRNAKNALELQQREESAAAMLRSITGRGSLGQIHEQIALIEDLNIEARDTRALAAEKLTLLCEERGRLLRYVDRIPPRIAEVEDAASLEDLRTDLLRNEAAFRNTPQSSNIEQALEHCNILRRFFGQLDNARAGRLDNRTRAQERIDEVNTLTAIYSGVLSDEQKALIPVAVSSILEEVRKQEALACTWLEELESAVHSDSELGTIAVRCSAPPSFLPLSLRPRLEALSHEIGHRVELRAQEAQAKAALRAISGKGGLVELERQLAAVQSITATSEDLQQIIEERTVTLQSEIGRLESFVAELGERLAQVRDEKSRDALKSEILRNTALFNASLRANTLEQCLAQCEVLRTFFVDCSTVRSSPLNTPEDAKEAFKQLGAMSQRYEPQLSTVQRGLIEETEAHLRARVRKAEEAALTWLAKLEADVAASSEFEELSKQVLSCPAFLSPACQPRLQGVTAELQKRADLHRREDAALREINSVPIKGTFAEIEQALAAIRSSEAVTEAVQAALDKRAAVMVEEMQRLDRFGADLLERMDQVEDAKALAHVQSEIMASLNLLQGCARWSDIERAIHRCEMLQQFFGTLARDRHVLPRNPAEAQSLRSELNQLRVQFADFLSDSQAALISARVSQIDVEVTRQEQKAAKWLEDCERALLIGKDLSSLSQDLKAAPSFLPESLGQRLNRLTVNTRQKIDEDQISQVLLHFRQITESSKRAECFAAIKSLMAQDNRP